MKRIASYFDGPIGGTGARPVDATRQQRCAAWWREVVDPAVFEHTRVVAFSDGHWTVYAGSGAWASRVREQRETIVGRLRAAGADLAELRIRVIPDGRRGGPDGP